MTISRKNRTLRQILRDSVNPSYFGVTANTNDCVFECIIFSPHSGYSIPLSFDSLTDALDYIDSKILQLQELEIKL